MKISAVSINTDILLTIESAAGITGFVGFRIERKRESGNWLIWDGTSFTDGGTAMLVPSVRFTDYDLEAGIYQYRYAIMTTILSDYAYSDWSRIGTEKTGWTFGNYAAPDGGFGDILTPDDLRYTYLWGIDFKASNGDTFSDAQIKAKIQSAVSEIARALKITITKTVIKCQPKEGKIGVDYDEAEDPYTYRHDKWQRTGRIVLRKRPILSIESFMLYGMADQKIIDLESWARIDHRKGVISFFPRAGVTGEIRIIPAAMAVGVSYRNGDYPHGYKIDYTAGYENSGMVPADLRDIIGKAAACKLLNIIGDGLLSGFSSSSLSLDGVSESFSSTQSATSAMYGARIKVYLDDIQTYLKENRSKFGNITIGSI